MGTPKRLIELMQKEIDAGESKRSLANKLGINTNGLDLYLEGKTEPRRAALERFAGFFAVSVDYILGKDNIPSLAEDFILIPRYGVRVSAGGGSFVDGEEVVDYLSFKRDWIENALGMKRDDLALVTVVGDSMIPTLADGDLVLIDLRNHNRLKNDSIYVIQIGDGLKVKRIQTKLDGTLVVKSDNKHYDPEVLGNPEMIRVVGRVVWAGKRM